MTHAVLGRALLAALVLGGGCRSAPETRHVLLITVDTLRADRLSAYDGTLDVTPHLDLLARESLRFMAAYATAPFTLPSIATLMTGRYPEELGIVANSDAVPADVPKLAGILRAHGWRTAAVVSNFVLREACGLADGFDRYDATLPQEEAHRQMPERTARATTDAALGALAFLAPTERRPTFLWVHYQDPHGPYVPPPGLRERYLPAEERAPDAHRQLPPSSDERGIGGIPKYQLDAGHRDPAWYRAGYDGEVRHTDDQIGRLLAHYMRRVPPEQGMVVFAADHGEGLGEGDYWFAHGEYLTDVLVRVPLLLRIPGHAPAVRRDVASLLDVLPTVLAALGMPDDPGRGRDLLAPGAARTSAPAYFTTLKEATRPRFGLVRDGLKYVVSFGAGGTREEVVTRDGERPEDQSALARMRHELTALRAQLPIAKAAAQVLTTDDRNRLRALGYVAGP